MQIHLFDCKSGNALQANLGRNKMQLCMLILDSLRDTYWSAGVMYRLFDRAQKILGGAIETQAQPEKNIEPSENAAPVSMDAYASVPGTNRVMSEFENFNPNSSETMAFGDPVLQNNSHVGPDFDALEQILSPGFYLSDVNTQALFMSYTSNPGEGGLPMNLYDVG